MNKVKLNTNAQKWVDALRSGKYKQAKRRLKYRGGMCCLGVACDLARKPLKLQWSGTEFDGSKKVLPDSVRQWLGMSSDNGKVAGIELDIFGHDCLAALNDHGATFTEIADLIEQHAENLGLTA